jgi:hypothetical protein
MLIHPLLLSLSPRPFVCIFVDSKEFKQEALSIRLCRSDVNGEWLD